MSGRSIIPLSSVGVVSKTTWYWQKSFPRHRPMLPRPMASGAGVTFEFDSPSRRLVVSSRLFISRGSSRSSANLPKLRYWSTVPFETDKANWTYPCFHIYLSHDHPSRVSPLLLAIGIIKWGFGKIGSNRQFRPEPLPSTPFRRYPFLVSGFHWTLLDQRSSLWERCLRNSCNTHAYV